jgi:hypothetical protein
MGKNAHFTSLNHPQSPIFLDELQNQINNLPQLFKGDFIFFILVEVLKIKVNHKKS